MDRSLMDAVSRQKPVAMRTGDIAVHRPGGAFSSGLATSSKQSGAYWHWAYRVEMEVEEAHA